VSLFPEDKLISNIYYLGRHHFKNKVPEIFSEEMSSLCSQVLELENSFRTYLKNNPHLWDNKHKNMPEAVKYIYNKL
jgi:hypothetical protein